MLKNSSILAWLGFVLPGKHCSEFFFLLSFSSFSRNNGCEKLSFPSGIFWRSIVEWKTNYYFVELQTGRPFIVYEVKIKRKCYHKSLAVLSQRKIAYGVEIWEQIVYISYCDVKHIMWNRSSLKGKTVKQERNVMHLTSIN